jgi:hypothetical protein
MPKLPFFGFGSLLDPESLAATVPDAYDILPAYITGFRRDFSFWDSAGWTESNLDLAGEAFCAIDARVSSGSPSKINGIIFQMGDTSYAKLLQREAGYELVKTKVYSFEDDESLGECFLFSSNKNNGVYDFESAAQKRYLEVCLRGASKYGEGFYQEFLNTTFIDGQCLSEVSALARICDKYSQVST